MAWIRWQRSTRTYKIDSMRTRCIGDHFQKSLFVNVNIDHISNNKRLYLINLSFSPSYTGIYLPCISHPDTMESINKQHPHKLPHEMHITIHYACVHIKCSHMEIQCSGNHIYIDYVHQIIYPMKMSLLHIQYHSIQCFFCLQSSTCRSPPTNIQYMLTYLQPLWSGH